MDYWRDKGCLITGGTAGLGLAIARQLALRQAKLLINGRDPARLEQAVTELRALGAQVEPHQGDLSHPGTCAELVRKGLQLWGGVDLACHAAGRSMRGRLLDTTPEQFEALWRLNTLAAFELARASAGPLATRAGHFVLIGSLASHVAPRFLGAYPATKFPLAALAQQMRLELGPEGLHTLLVSPGPMSRPDSAPRYQEDATSDLPGEAHRPGGGAKVELLDPEGVAMRILAACERRRPVLVLPAKARWLFVINQLSAGWGDWLLRKMTS